MSAYNLLDVFLFAFGASFGAVISPGPVSAAIVTEAPRLGWKVGPLIASGHTLLELVMVVLISLGLSIGMANPDVRIAIAFGGGLVLLAIGASYIFGAWKGTTRLPQAVSAATPRTVLSLITLGGLTTISNPFWYTWWVTVAAGYLMQAKALSLAAIGVFYIGHICADFAWDTALSFATSTGRRWLTDARYRAIIAITGGFMIYLGVVFLSSAIHNR
jgi:threonine/homoserine/homoserine lactone efflux protein